jgi:hypothetical protein
VSGPDVVPKEVTALLGLVPSTSAWPKPAAGSIRCWHYSTASELASTDEAEHLEYLLTRLTSRVAVLRELGAEAELLINLELPSGTSWPYPRYYEFLSRVRALGAGIDFEALGPQVSTGA